jgi:dipeptidyl-peptidase-4
MWKWLLTVCLCGSMVSAADPDFLEAYSATDRFRLGTPQSIKITPQGDAILFLRSGPRDFTRNLYSLNPLTGEEQVLLTAEDILQGKEETLSAEEQALRERLRLAARGIASYQLSDDGKKLLVPLAGRLFVIDRKSGTVNALPDTGGYPFDPQFSPDATYVSYVKDAEVHLLEIATGKIRRITEGAGGKIVHGISEFVAQEEMSRNHGYWWSPDGRSILYQETDHTGVESMHIVDPSRPEKDPQSWPYPRPGKQNAKVRLGLISLVSEKIAPTQWIEWDREAFEYLATVKWQKNAPLTLVVQNRNQTVEKILVVDTSTGETSTLHTELDPMWVDLDQDFPLWLADGSGFLWRTDRNGGSQIELHDRKGKLKHAVTQPEFGLRGMVVFQEKQQSLIVRASNDPRRTDLWRVPLYPRDGDPERLTKIKGEHAAVADADGPWMVVESATPNSLSVWQVMRKGKATGVTVRTVRESPGSLPDPQYDRVGENPALNTVMIRPTDFDATKSYPVIVHVYGGPTSQMVRMNAARYLLDQWIADHGYVIVSIDGRGTPNHGSAWNREVKHDVIEKPLADQVRALTALGKKYPYLDLERVGIYGWSFGGYFSAMAVMREPELFKVGVAGAPVVAWEDYDTHYTERYMGLPQDNPDGYNASNVLSYADRLERPLLIIHGTADDNVYFLHSLKLVDALFRAGKSFDFLPLAGSTHRVKDPVVVEKMYGRMMETFAWALTPLTAPPPGVAVTTPE